MRAGAYLVLLTALLTAADEPLQIADLVRYVQAGFSERIILAEVRERGIAEPMGAEEASVSPAHRMPS